MILTSIPSMRILLNAVTGMADIVCQMLLSHQFCYNHVFSFFYVSNFITKIDLPADERSYISKRTENETTLSYGDKFSQLLYENVFTFPLFLNENFIFGC